MADGTIPPKVTSSKLSSVAGVSVQVSFQWTPHLDSLNWQERIQPFCQKVPQPCPHQVSMRTELPLLLDPSSQWHQMKGALLAPAQHQCPRLGQPSPQLNAPFYFCSTSQATRSPLLIVGRPGACQQHSDFPPKIKIKSYCALPMSEESDIILIQEKRFSAMSHLMTAALHPLFAPQAQGVQP